MEKVTIPEGTKGNWTIKHVVTDHIDWHTAQHGRNVPVGEQFTILYRDSTLVMSDTPAERYDHIYAVAMAKGSCLINGLGIGMVLKNILLKPEVTDVTVVELSQDLIDLVGPHYNDPRVNIVCCSAFDYKPPKGKRYSMVWHDIWDTICGDNLPEMIKLHRKYGRRCDWQGSWAREMCERYR
jgi:hypothetical protein